jgi:predicted Rossmann fold flavoprotein
MRVTPAVPADEAVDLAIVGAGAAGLATAIFAARTAWERSVPLRVWCFDGARTLGAKILVSGGSRCNVTNRVVTERDFWGGSPRAIRNVLRAYPAARAAAFFGELGVPLHEEEDGKLFPDTNRSRTVLDALLAEIGRLGVHLASATRVVGVGRAGDRFTIECADGRQLQARAVVLSTGGRSLPKSGSDGYGYQIAEGLGHGYVATTPALVPLLLDGTTHAALSGVTIRASLSLLAGARTIIRLDGPLLWTHFGASGPLVLNMSRHWLRARLEGQSADVTINLFPGASFETVDAWLLAQERERPRARLSTILSARLPAALAAAWPAAAGIDPERTLAHMPREDRRRLVHALVAAPLAVRDSRGYTYAEVTAGGVPLDEVDPATMQSRLCPGLYFAGEILDVDGRLGGFNFQWSWSSGWVAGRAAAAMLTGTAAASPLPASSAAGRPTGEESC